MESPLLATPNGHNRSVRQSKRWQIVYQGHDVSDIVCDEDLQGFKGSEEEYDLFIYGLINKRRQNFVSEKNSLLSEVSNTLEESVRNISNQEYVSVQIHDFGGQDYTVKLDYTYHAYDPTQGSFEDETSSRSQQASSKEQVLSILRSFVGKHCNESVAKLSDYKVKTAALKKDLAILEKDIKSEGPLLKKPRTELRQLTLKESTERLLKRKVVLKNSF